IRYGTHVFVSRDWHRRTFEPAYDGLFKVLQREPKYYIIDKNGTNDSISIDRLKAAYLERNPVHVDFPSVQSKDTTPAIIIPHPTANTHDDTSIVSENKLKTTRSVRRASLFRIRYNCLQLTKEADEDYNTYAGRVNLQAERFKLNVLTSDQFKCLLFISGLNSPVDADFRMKLLSRMEYDDEMTLQTITTECRRLINLKQDTAMLETKSAAPSNSVHAVKAGQRQNSTKSHKYRSKTPKLATKCWYCGA
ncbi:unnamed protein product, partial [Schistosoma curassoni]|uniref:Gag-Pol polyprotein n=1 Tax=Schistosoma curassoni TaxID=6186 RepID=A0A183L5P5_9TREM